MTDTVYLNKDLRSAVSALCYSQRGVRMETLEELEELKQCRFGQPRPRHGLKLLYWFVKDCLYFSQSDVLHLNCYPENGDFGFHKFENRYGENGDKLLPVVTFPYYVLGNLTYVKASKLPKYVREHYIHSENKCNMDRIIISLKNKCFCKLYVTEHSDRTNFNKNSTYNISIRLILTIRDLELDEFLLQAGYMKKTNSCLIRPLKRSDLQPSSPTQPTHFIPTPVTMELRSIQKKNNKQENCTQPSPSIHGPVQGSHKNNHDASPTPSIFGSLSKSSSTQNSSTLPQSNFICTHNKTQKHTTATGGETDICVQDNTIQTSSDSNLQTPSNDIPAISTWTAAIMSPFTQMNYSFCLVLLLFWVFFFYFIWGNVMRLFILIMFVVLISTIQTSRDFNLQTPSNDMPPTST